MAASETKDGDRVEFSAGRAGTRFKAKVVGRDGAFVLTKDADGKARKVRPGACTVIP